MGAKITIFWTDQEIELLKQIGNSKKLNKIQKEDFPHRTIGQLSDKRRGLGIAIAKNIPFEQWELDIIKEKYQKADRVNDFIHLLRAGRHRGTVVKKANEMGLIKQIEYNKNREYFNEPNLENCAIAGFIASDGNIHKNKLTIKISNKDHNFLCKIRDKVGYEGPIAVVNRIIKVRVARQRNQPDRVGQYSILQIFCPEYAKPLNKNWNITPNKSLTLGAPNIINYEQCLAYYAGLINGDGSVCLMANPHGRIKKNLSINITGTKGICEWVKFITDLIAPNCSQNGLSNIREPRGETRAYTYAVSGSRATIVAQEILKLEKEILLLDRKWDVARNYIAEQNSIDQYMLTSESLEKNTAHIEQNRHTFEEKISQYVENGLLTVNI